MLSKDWFDSLFVQTIGKTTCEFTLFSCLLLKEHVQKPQQLLVALWGQAAFGRKQICNILKHQPPHFHNRYFIRVQLKERKTLHM
jgi:hypothetical protein